MESMKARFVPPPPMTRAPETRNKNKFCEFHRDKGHNTYHSIHLKRQIEEAVKSRQPTHLVKEIKQSNSKGSVNKAAKKLEPVGKEKGAVIFMVQSWQRHTRPVVKAVHPSQMNISFPPLTVMDIEDYVPHGYEQMEKVDVGNCTVDKILWEISWPITNGIWFWLAKIMEVSDLVVYIRLTYLFYINRGLVPSSSLKRKIGDGMKELKNVVVEDRWNGSSFSWNWRRPLRGDDVVIQWIRFRLTGYVNTLILPPIEFLDFVNSQGNLHKAKDVLFTIIYTAWWELWRFRNESIFRPGKKRDVGMVDSIIHFSDIWYRNRHKKAIARSPSQYNGIQGRPGIWALGAVVSTAHGMKFPT
ncbi:retrotransposon gag domain-containing protein [Artemisia annua]|uniref:Retrotransposon gag domain-containing protein n=1 Tax=Artemisia annua TaxID=35608 RepID=A0A2U1KZ42_ARTAN|nr:retrotransposon gag domain-containing protein [Artemisia annua]